MYGTKRGRAIGAAFAAATRAMNSSLSKKISASMATSYCNLGNGVTDALKEAQLTRLALR
jgi:hypothetical protein